MALPPVDADELMAALHAERRRTLERRHGQQPLPMVDCGPEYVEWLRDEAGAILRSFKVERRRS